MLPFNRNVKLKLQKMLLKKEKTRRQKSQGKKNLYENRSNQIKKEQPDKQKSELQMTFLNLLGKVWINLLVWTLPNEIGVKKF